MNGRQTTGRDLSADEAFAGLLDFGLFAEKLPPCFTSEGLSTHLTRRFKRISTEIAPKTLRRLLDSHSRGYVRYQSLRDVNVPRQMGIPHPQSYSAHCLIIYRFWKEITRHCAKPKNPLSRIFVRRTQSERVFRMNYKGVECLDQEEDDLELLTGARFVVHADISTCFPSIYTHSIPWALHGKGVAKKSRGCLALTGNVLDKATQMLRDKQTNGLLIGPHSSNVISEGSSPKRVGGIRARAAVGSAGGAPPQG